MKLSRMHAAYTWPQDDGDMSVFPSSVDPKSTMPPCEHKHRTSNGALRCSRERQAAMGVGSDGRTTITVEDVKRKP